MKILFLDESGDHNLTFFDPNYPVFVLAGCIMSQKEHDEKLIQGLKRLKKKVFGSEKIILHYLDYTRNQNGFEKMSEVSLREDFYKKLNQIIFDTEFTLIGSIVDKKKHRERYKTLAINPYTLSLEVVIERFVIVKNQMILKEER